jgi:hypothetical protein
MKVTPFDWLLRLKLIIEHYSGALTFESADGQADTNEFCSVVPVFAPPVFAIDAQPSGVMPWVAKFSWLNRLWVTPALEPSATAWLIGAAHTAPWCVSHLGREGVPGTVSRFRSG